MNVASAHCVYQTRVSGITPFAWTTNQKSLQHYPMLQAFSSRLRASLSRCLLLQQAQRSLWPLIGLGQYRGSRLLQNLIPG